MTTAVLLAGLAGVAAVPAAWLALAAADEAHLVRAGARWLARTLPPGRREPTDPERRRLALLGALCLLGAGWLLAGRWAGLALAAAGPWAVRGVLRARARRWRAEVAADAPGVARALADALAGGHPVRTALIQVARSGASPGPARALLRAAAAQLDLGEPTDEVLRALARRAGGGPYDALVSGLVVQRRTGGDLPALLRTLADSLEERGRALGEARAATAQARFTAVLVTALPLAGAAVTELSRPGSITGLAGAPLPALLAGSALVLQLLALLLVRRIARAGTAG